MAQAQNDWEAKALSMNPPSQADLVLNESLLEELKRQGSFESPEDTQKRVQALACLQKITEEFVRQAMGKKGKFSQATIKAAGGKIFPFGSYKLGCHTPGSDIDCLIVAPNGPTRDDFFDIFPGLLDRMAPPGAITELTPVPSAFIPIITFAFAGIDIDVSFVSVGLSSVSKDMDLRDDSLLRGLDDRGQKSMNGPRVAEQILDLVPEPSVFKTALRAIKQWGKARAIYANIMGFPGGVAWAILVARVCQLYPRAAASKIVSKFFWVIYQWQFPEPIYLKVPERGPSGILASVWNPQKNRADASSIMPIITPAFPSMNSTYNVFDSTMKILKKELLHASELCEQISQNKLQWKHLFAKHSFFTEDYRHYLAINATSRTKEAQQSWSGTVESKVRILAREIDREKIEIAHPFVKGFQRVHAVHTEEQLTEVTEGSLKYQVKEIKTETTDDANSALHKAAADLADNNVTVEESKDEEKPDVKEGGEITLYTTTYYIGLQFYQAAGVQLDVSWAINKFRELCKGNTGYKDGVNFVFVYHTRSFDLPDDVFSEGEKKPTRKKKAARKANGEANGTTKKRKLEDGSAETIKK